MCLVLFLLWCSAIVGRCGLNILCYNSHNSRFGAFNSRLRQPKFPVQTTTGICPQEIDFAHRFRGETAIEGENRRNSRYWREKPGFCPRCLPKLLVVRLSERGEVELVDPVTRDGSRPRGVPPFAES